MLTQQHKPDSFPFVAYAHYLYFTTVVGTTVLYEISQERKFPRVKVS